MFVQITSQILNSSQLLCIFPVCSTSLTCSELACSDRNKQVWLIATRQWDTSLEINVCVLFFPPLSSLCFSHAYPNTELTRIRTTSEPKFSDDWHHSWSSVIVLSRLCFDHDAVVMRDFNLSCSRKEMQWSAVIFIKDATSTWLCCKAFSCSTYRHICNVLSDCSFCSFVFTKAFLEII